MKGEVRAVVLRLLDSCRLAQRSIASIAAGGVTSTPLSTIALNHVRMSWLPARSCCASPLLHRLPHSDVIWNCENVSDRHAHGAVRSNQLCDMAAFWHGSLLTCSSILEDCNHRKQTETTPVIQIRPIVFLTCSGAIHIGIVRSGKIDPYCSGLAATTLCSFEGVLAHKTTKKLEILCANLSHCDLIWAILRKSEPIQANLN